MEFRRARAEDFSAILDLQAANLRGNLSPEDQREGFLSAEFTRQQLAEMASGIALVVASEKDQVCGYLCAYGCDYGKQFPILATMIDSFDRIFYQGKPLSAYHCFVYGPVCVDKSLRGRGLLRGLYDFLLREVARRYDLGVAFVSKDNPHSLAAHVNGLGMSIAGEFEFRSGTYDILVFGAAS